LLLLTVFLGIVPKKWAWQSAARGHLIFGAAVESVFTMQDTNARRLVTGNGTLADLQAHLRATLDLCEEGACLALSSGEVIFANRALLSWLQRLPSEDSLQCVWDWLPTTGGPGFRSQFADVNRGLIATASFSSYLTAYDGTPVPVEVQIAGVGSEPAEMLAIVFRRRIVGDSALLPEHSAQRTDPLTGLPDRDALMHRLRSVLDRVSATKQRFALLFIDVDGFKQVNDRFGHLIGDQVLQEVARRLAACVRSGDHLARFGGDEFVVLVDGIGNRSGGVRTVVNRICTAFKSVFELPSGEVRLSVSVGVAEPSAACATAEDLLHAADKAMYAAKRGES
jgi:diguanylate cyclase (GGDEF)-like protein